MAKNKTAKRAEARRKAQKAQGEEQGGKFRVLRGSHIVGGKVYRKGEIVESDQDLVARFKEEGRFKRVGGASLQSEDEDDEEDIPVTATSAAAAKKNPKGEHDRSMGAVEDPEDEEDEEDEEADDEEEDDEEVVEASAQSEEDEEEEEEESEEEEEDEGEDVTSEFKKEAKAAKATVTKTGRTYTIEDKQGNVIGKKSGYTRKDEVLKALKKAAK